jgi:hypothetical protein
MGSLPGRTDLGTPSTNSSPRRCPVGWGVPIRALQGGCEGPQEGFVSFQRVLIEAQSVSHCGPIDCFKRASVSSLKEPCSDSRGCQVLAPEESLLKHLTPP